MKAIVMKKTELERKYTRDLSTAKVEIQKAKEREKIVGLNFNETKKDNIRTRKIEKKNDTEPI